MFLLMIIGAVLLTIAIMSLAVGTSGYYDNHLDVSQAKTVFRITQIAAVIGFLMFWVSMFVQLADRNG